VLNELQRMIASGKGRAAVRIGCVEIQPPVNGKAPVVEQMLKWEDAILLEADAVGVAYEVDGIGGPWRRFVPWHSIFKIVV
jgi:hypothetical protein